MDSRVVPALRGSVRAASCRFPTSFPGACILGGISGGGGGDVLSHPLGSRRRRNCRSLLCRQPPRSPPLPTPPRPPDHPPTRPPPRIHPCAPPATYGEPEVVAPLAEVALAVVLLLIEPALVEFSCVGAAGQWWAGASIGAGAMRSECVHDRAPAYGWLQAVGSDVVLGACMRCVGCGGHSHYYESSEQLVIQ